MQSEGEENGLNLTATMMDYVFYVLRSREWVKCEGKDNGLSLRVKRMD